METDRCVGEGSDLLIPHAVRVRADDDDASEAFRGEQSVSRARAWVFAAFIAAPVISKGQRPRSSDASPCAPLPGSGCAWCGAALRAPPRQGCPSSSTSSRRDGQGGVLPLLAASPAARLHCGADDPARAAVVAVGHQVRLAPVAHVAAVRHSRVADAAALVDEQIAVVVLAVVAALDSWRKWLAGLWHAIDASARQRLPALADAALLGTVEALVDLAVTVVVLRIAYLHGQRRVGRARLWRAVRAGGHRDHALSHAADEVRDALVRRAVAVVVLAVARLCRGRGAGRAGLGDTAYARCHGVLARADPARDGRQVVGCAVAVVVQPVTDLFSRRTVRSRGTAPPPRRAHAQRVRAELVAPVLRGRERRPWWALRLVADHVAGKGIAAAARNGRKVRLDHRLRNGRAQERRLRDAAAWLQAKVGAQRLEIDLRLDDEGVAHADALQMVEQRLGLPRRAAKEQGQPCEGPKRGRNSSARPIHWLSSRREVGPDARQKLLRPVYVFSRKPNAGPYMFAQIVSLAVLKSATAELMLRPAACACWSRRCTRSTTAWSWPPTSTSSTTQDGVAAVHWALVVHAWATSWLQIRVPLGSVRHATPLPQSASAVHVFTQICLAVAQSSRCEQGMLGLLLQLHCAG